VSTFDGLKAKNESDGCRLGQQAPYWQAEFTTQPSVEHPNIMKTAPAVTLSAAKQNDMVSKFPADVAGAT
jgi:hypothetical protein